MRSDFFFFYEVPERALENRKNLTINTNKYWKLNRCSEVMCNFDWPVVSTGVFCWLIEAK